MNRLHTRRAARGALALALVGGSSIALASAAQADPNANITYCHATGNPDKWVIVTSDGASILQEGHDTHQGDRDVIPPFEYVAENGGEVKSFPGQNWENNWPTNGEATPPLDKKDTSVCGGDDETETPKPSPTSPKPSPSSPKPTPSTPGGGGTETPKPTTPGGGGGDHGGSGGNPSGPVLETDIVEHDNGPSMLPVLGGGLALVLGGGAAAAAVARRRGDHA
ncbi:hypothetical protein BCF74_105157 [Knoellia remsis]|uniref:LPXTG-motif cell wall-anchored protein n=1 Tax=Knoellia remsis TaxID=407159 RepID=A0A2T0UUR5_9MICO|nr:hypothetical protein [Knoellia remsis]PRY61598.1 hypothetical protein BCF74_105157 [Knoellia remsis]